MNREIIISIREAESLIHNGSLILNRKMKSSINDDYRVKLKLNKENIIEENKKPIILFSDIHQFEIYKSDEVLFTNLYRVPKGLLRVTNKTHTNKEVNEVEQPSFVNSGGYLNLRNGLLSMVHNKYQMQAVFGEKYNIDETLQSFFNLSDVRKQLIMELLDKKQFPLLNKIPKGFTVVTDVYRRIFWWGSFVRDNYLQTTILEELERAEAIKSPKNKIKYSSAKSINRKERKVESEVKDTLQGNLAFEDFKEPGLKNNDILDESIESKTEIKIKTEIVEIPSSDKKSLSKDEAEKVKDGVSKVEESAANKEVLDDKASNVKELGNISLEKNKEEHKEVTNLDKEIIAEVEDMSNNAASTKNKKNAQSKKVDGARNKEKNKPLKKNEAKQNQEPDTFEESNKSEGVKTSEITKRINADNDKIEKESEIKDLVAGEKVVPRKEKENKIDKLKKGGSNNKSYSFAKTRIDPKEEEISKAQKRVNEIRNWVSKFVGVNDMNILNNQLATIPEEIKEEVDFLVGYCLAATYYNYFKDDEVYYRNQYELLKYENKDELYSWTTFFVSLLRDDMHRLHFVKSLNPQINDVERMAYELTQNNFAIEDKTIYNLQFKEIEKEQLFKDNFTLVKGEDATGFKTISMSEAKDVFKNNLMQDDLPYIGLEERSKWDIKSFIENVCSTFDKKMKIIYNVFNDNKEVVFYLDKSSKMTKELKKRGFKVDSTNKLIDKNKRALLIFKKISLFEDKSSLIYWYAELLKGNKSSEIERAVIVLLVDTKKYDIRSLSFGNQVKQVKNDHSTLLGIDVEVIVKDILLVDDSEVKRYLRNTLKDYKIEEIEVVDENFDNEKASWLLDINSEYFVEKENQNYYSFFN